MGVGNRPGAATLRIMRARVTATLEPPRPQRLSSALPVLTCPTRMRRAAFVVPYRLAASLRFLRAALSLPDTRLALISCDPLEAFDEDIRQRLAGHWQVRNALDASQLAEACRGLGAQLGGPVERLVGILEQMQVPLAQAREALAIPGLSVDAARNFRDKARMKDVLSASGLPCARHALIASRGEAAAFAQQVGFPLVYKPPAGAGAVDTFRVDDAGRLTEILAAVPPSAARPALLEEFVVGEEHSFDAVCVDGRMVWHSVSRYLPSPLTVTENDWIQWIVLLPRDIDGPEYAAIRQAGPAALSALGLQTGLVHGEWFRRADGSVAISEIGARPPGAQITSLLSVAHDTDMYVAWTRLVIHDTFTPPQRVRACGAAYFRGQGSGRRVVALHGIEQAQAELGELVVDVKLPEAGQPRSKSYEGEGYAIVAHPDTAVVEEALRRLVQIVQVQLG